MLTTSRWTFPMVALTAILVIGLAVGTGGQSPPAAGINGGEKKAVNPIQSQRTTAKPGKTKFDYDPRTAIEQKIFAQLDSPTSIDFKETPLSQVCAFLSTRHKINIVIDEQSLRDEGILTASITLSIKDVRLKSVLRLMLMKLNLEYLVQNEVLKITTQAIADEYLETHVYDVTSLKDIRLKRLVSIIQNAVPHAIWLDVDGDPNGGAVEAVPGLLIIKQTQRVHAGICDLLRQLATAKAAQKAAGVIICPRPAKTHGKRPKKKQTPPSFGRISVCRPFPV